MTPLTFDDGTGPFESYGFWAGSEELSARLITGTLYAGDNKVLLMTDGPAGPEAAALHTEGDGVFSATITNAQDASDGHPSQFSFSEFGCWDVTVSSENENVSFTVYIYPDWTRTYVAGNFSFRVIDYKLDEDGSGNLHVTMEVTNDLSSQAVSPADLLKSVRLRTTSGEELTIDEQATLSANSLGGSLDDIVADQSEPLTLTLVFPMGADAGAQGLVLVIPVVEAPVIEIELD